MSSCTPSPSIPAHSMAKLNPKLCPQRPICDIVVHKGGVYEVHRKAKCHKPNFPINSKFMKGELKTTFVHYSLLTDYLSRDNNSWPPCPGLWCDFLFSEAFRGSFVLTTTIRRRWRRRRTQQSLYKTGIFNTYTIMQHWQCYCFLFTICTED